MQGVFGAKVGMLLNVPEGDESLLPPRKRGIFSSEFGAFEQKLFFNKDYFPLRFKAPVRKIQKSLNINPCEVNSLDGAR